VGEMTKLPTSTPDKMIVLLVEDDEDDIEFFTDAIHIIDPSITLRVVHNGLEALDLLETGFVPDHIFLDINMPLMNGLDCVTEIQKRFPDLNSSLTILSSAREYVSRLNRIKHSVHYNTKPADPADLVEIIRNRITE
jgi:CheY-like chemotaxis protein